jgi:hypothetical protein
MQRICPGSTSARQPLSQTMGPRSIAAEVLTVLGSVLVTAPRRRSLGLPLPARGRSCWAGVAQLVEHLICNQTVGGSNPFASSRVPPF